MALGPRSQARLLASVTRLRSGGGDVDRPVLYAIYGTDIIVRLKRIHAHPERDGPNGWLVVALHGRSPAYVHCRFADSESLLCETIVGRHPESEQPSTVSADIEEGLKRSGYWRGSSGRALFKYEITPDSSVWGGASAVILDPLISVFAARAGSRIEIIAPLASERDEAAIQRELRRS